MKKVLLLFLTGIMCILGAILLDALQMITTGSILIILGLVGNLATIFCLIWEGVNL